MGAGCFMLVASSHHPHSDYSDQHHIRNFSYFNLKQEEIHSFTHLTCALMNAQGYFGIRTGAAGTRTTNLPVSLKLSADESEAVSRVLWVSLGPLRLPRSRGIFVSYLCVFANSAPNVSRLYSVCVAVEQLQIKTGNTLSHPADQRCLVCVFDFCKNLWRPDSWSSLCYADGCKPADAQTRWLSVLAFQTLSKHF